MTRAIIGSASRRGQQCASTAIAYLRFWHGQALDSNQVSELYAIALVPTFLPTLDPSALPTLEPTFEPSALPTLEPTFEPTPEPSQLPTHEPTLEP